VFGGKIIECQQHIAVLLETLDGLVIFGAIGREVSSRLWKTSAAFVRLGFSLIRSNPNCKKVMVW
jgi:hypothetical protein